VRIGGGGDGAMMTACANAGTLASVATAVIMARAAFTANVGEARPFSVFITVPWTSKTLEACACRVLKRELPENPSHNFLFFPSESQRDVALVDAHP
jgi:hypothetical protein